MRNSIKPPSSFFIVVCIFLHCPSSFAETLSRSSLKDQATFINAPQEEALPGFTQSIAKQGLSPSAAEVAKDLGLLPLFKIVEDTETAKGTDSFEAFRLRQRLLERLLIVSFEIRASLAKIDYNITQTAELHSLMEEKREHKVQASEIANFLQSGTTEIISTSMADFKRDGKLSVPGAIVGVLGGSMEIGLSTYSAKLNKGGHLSAPAKPNMLAHLFGYSDEFTKFSTGVWNYLNDPRRGSRVVNETRKSYLIAQWIKFGHLPAGKSPESSHRVKLLAGVIPANKEVTIDLLEDRALMLADLRSVVSQMDQDMLEIMEFSLLSKTD
jgi:hypothetical protein